MKILVYLLESHFFKYLINMKHILAKKANCVWYYCADGSPPRRTTLLSDMKEQRALCLWGAKCWGRENQFVVLFTKLAFLLAIHYLTFLTSTNVLQLALRCSRSKISVEISHLVLRQERFSLSFLAHSQHIRNTKKKVVHGRPRQQSECGIVKKKERKQQQSFEFLSNLYLPPWPVAEQNNCCLFSILERVVRCLNFSSMNSLGGRNFTLNLILNFEFLQCNNKVRWCSKSSWVNRQSEKKWNLETPHRSFRIRCPTRRLVQRQRRRWFSNNTHDRSIGLWVFCVVRFCCYSFFFVYAAPTSV